MQTAERPGIRWKMAATYDFLTADDLNKLLAFLASLRGRAGRFLAHDLLRPSPLGVATGAPIVTALSSGANIGTSNWTHSITGIMKAGDKVGLNGELRMLIADLTSDGSGNATMQLDAPLRAAVAANTPVIVSAPSCVMCLDSDDTGYTWSGGSTPAITITATEVFA